MGPGTAVQGRGLPSVSGAGECGTGTGSCSGIGDCGTRISEAWGRSSPKELVTWHTEHWGRGCDTGICGAGAEYRGCSQAGTVEEPEPWAAAAHGAPPGHHPCAAGRRVHCLWGAVRALSPHTDPSSVCALGSACTPARSKNPILPPQTHTGPWGPQELSAEPVPFNENECSQLGQMRFLSS